MRVLNNKSAIELVIEQVNNRAFEIHELIIKNESLQEVSEEIDYKLQHPYSDKIKNNEYDENYSNLNFCKKYITPLNDELILLINDAIIFTLLPLSNIETITQK